MSLQHVKVHFMLLSKWKKNGWKTEKAPVSVQTFSFNPKTQHSATCNSKYTRKKINTENSFILTHSASVPVFTGFSWSAVAYQDSKFGGFYEGKMWQNWGGTIWTSRTVKTLKKHTFFFHYHSRPLVIRPLEEAERHNRPEEY